MLCHRWGEGAAPDTRGVVVSAHVQVERTGSELPMPGSSVASRGRGLQRKVHHAMVKRLDL